MPFKIFKTLDGASTASDSQIHNSLNRFRADSIAAGKLEIAAPKTQIG